MRGGSWSVRPPFVSVFSLRITFIPMALMPSWVCEREHTHSVRVDSPAVSHAGDNPRRCASDGKLRVVPPSARLLAATHAPLAERASEQASEQESESGRDSGAAERARAKERAEEGGRIGNRLLRHGHAELALERARARG